MAIPRVLTCSTVEVQDLAHCQAESIGKCVHLDLGNQGGMLSLLAAVFNAKVTDTMHTRFR